MDNEKMIIKAFNDACKEYSCNIRIDELGTNVYAFINEVKNTTLSLGNFLTMNYCMEKYTNKFSVKTPAFRDTVRNNLLKMIA